jgi:hypothetical protein
MGASDKAYFKRGNNSLMFFAVALDLPVATADRFRYQTLRTYFLLEVERTHVRDQD